MIVAVSQRVMLLEEVAERRDSLDQRLARWLMSCGLSPAPASNGLAAVDLERWLEVIVPGGVVLSGGNDIGEAPERDETERQLLAYASQRRLPVLGICRGMQMMAVLAGEELQRLDGHVRRRHQLVEEPGAVGTWPIEVNSYHQWTLGDCPRGFAVQVRSSLDQAIEAIRHNALPWEGWMWHPEREVEFSACDAERAMTLFKTSVRIEGRSR